MYCKRQDDKPKNKPEKMQTCKKQDDTSTKKSSENTNM